MKRYLVAIALLPCIVEAQSNEVISVGGQQMEQGFVISGTFGQSFVNQEESSTFHLSEGFQQIHLLKPKSQLIDDIAVFPNPTNQFIFLQSNHSIKNVTITNMDGLMMKSIDIDNNERIQIDLQNLPAAVYLVKVTYDDLSPAKISKIIKI